jgi:hypothetical protein
MIALDSKIGDKERKETGCAHRNFNHPDVAFDFPAAVS